MELLIAPLGLLLFIIGSLRLKRGKGYRIWLSLAILCFVASLVIGGLRLLDGMTIPF